MEIGSLLIVGVIVSLITQLLKKRFGTQSNLTIAIVICLSLVTGAAYFFLKDSSYYENVLQILISAGAVYTFIIQRFE